MDALTISALVAGLALLGALLWWWRRTRADQRLQWQATRQRDWTTDELAALRATESAA